ncbi:hypothetical protein A3H03_03080 [Candidatus Kuenenbacteria bacterium RIFCSPLOWO2_12_FULL_42_13]|uniref:Glycosyltransferase n=3 Tax=Candidatus Kueneniibacteriota TaxID=1752740 RepID=A0A0G0YXI1_9BACT|nr:MAG: Glycosyltransferase [Candidatus Kuenenbacteria bacterium GW2011_GWA2_42_15]OGG89621.1 MAG: hypothetical protein A3C68_00220 [Candidatus Kuenenbacteria bacterium RIFCSPHIGHO2_02_FULL_42_29]OGG92308.1 MAG: hypothetical protein A3H03_03080 [Candidatus Kuenenbacteria bacterium RIFCSPLOWO2_12_FULL_42_13]
MYLLMITRKVDKQDSRASFVFDWLFVLAKNLEKLVVICQEKGDTRGLPANVEIYSLGKELGRSKIRQFFLAQKFLFRLVKKCAGVFAHQMPIYSILLGPWCRIFHKKLIQWYTHSSVDWRLRLANFFIDEYATASKNSFRLKTKKTVHVLGHGINVSRFAPTANIISRRETNSLPTGDHPKRDKFQILTVGRISPSKDYESMIKAVYELKERGFNNIKLTIVGAPVEAPGLSYLASLQAITEKMNLQKQVEFIGGIPNDQTVPYLQNADLFINLSDTGSLDKAVLEAMSCGCLVLTSNVAYQTILPPELFIAKDNPQVLAGKIKELMHLVEDKKDELRKQLREEVVAHHNLGDFVGKIVGLY